MNSNANPTVGSNHTLSRPKPDGESLSAEERMDRAVARIESSRSALIVCLAPDEPKRKRRSTNTGVATDGVADNSDLSFIDSLKARIERNGLLQGSWRTARALARRWWTRQPWHNSVDLVVDTLVHEARPLIRRHPLATLALGAVLGAALVAVGSAVRPWASHQIRGQSSTWAGRVSSLVWSQFSSAPMQMAVAGALTAWVADQAARRKQASASSSDGVAPDVSQAEGVSSAEKLKPM